MITIASKDLKKLGDVVSDIHRPTVSASKNVTFLDDLSIIRTLVIADALRYS